MGPETAVPRRVWVALFVGVLVVHAMDSDEEDRAAFQGERATDGEEVLHPLVGLVAAMGQEAVVSHSDAEASGDPPKEDRNEERFPGEEEERSYRSNMKGDHKEGCYPDDGLRKRSVIPQIPHEIIFLAKMFPRAVLSRMRGTLSIRLVDCRPFAGTNTSVR